MQTIRTSLSPRRSWEFRFKFLATWPACNGIGVKIIICLYCAQGSLFVNNHNIELPYVIVTAYLLKQFRSHSIYYFSVKSVYTSLSVLERCFKYNRLIADSLMDILSRGKIWIISSDQSYMYISTGHTPERHRQTVVDFWGNNGTNCGFLNRQQHRYTWSSSDTFLIRAPLPFTRTKLFEILFANMSAEHGFLRAKNPKCILDSVEQVNFVESSDQTTFRKTKKSYIWTLHTTCWNEY